MDYNKLLESSEYKEIYRVDMIEWGEKKRKEDPSFFCRHAISVADADDKYVWIISDARRKTDLEFFFTNYPGVSKSIRIIASEETRQERNWEFVKGVDDAESECDLDDIQIWDFIVKNDNDDRVMKSSVQKLIDYVNSSS